MTIRYLREQSRNNISSRQNETLLKKEAPNSTRRFVWLVISGGCEKHTRAERQNDRTLCKACKLRVHASELSLIYHLRGQVASGEKNLKDRSGTQVDIERGHGCKCVASYCMHKGSPVEPLQ